MRFIRATVVIFMVSWFLVTSLYVAEIDSTVRQQRQTIEQLTNDFNEAQAELADLRHQQEFVNNRSVDLSARLAEAQGWSKRR